MFNWFIAVSAFFWVALLLLPWRPWSTRERLRINDPRADRELFEITALIPARNEAMCIADTLQKLDRQGEFARIVVIDDQSDDGTGDIARNTLIPSLTVVTGSAPPEGWSGKLWALQQGLQYCESNYVLLLDADIGLQPGAVPALLSHMETNQLDMASVMANLHMEKFWEKLLLPPFVYFFKLIYPFALASSPGSRVAAAAGGCALVRLDKLCAIGGFAALKDAIIDDCTLARLIKESSGRIWIGLSNDARALRPYQNLSNIWNMVARTAYTQLRYSRALLLGCTLLMVLSYVVPIVALFSGTNNAQLLGAIALTAMLGSYLPTVRYYGLPAYWVVTLPAAAVMFLAMTWTSAIRYARGERSRWKNRSYPSAQTNMGKCTFRLPRTRSSTDETRLDPTMTRTILYPAIAAIFMYCQIAIAAENLAAGKSVVEKFHSNLLQVMTNADGLGFNGRVDALDAVLAETFDFPTIARIVTGQHWKTLDDDQRAEFIAVFGDLSAATYASNFDGFSGEAFETVGVEEKRGNILVKTVIVRVDDDPVTLDYVLRDNDGMWRIVNVIANGVSDLSLKRSDYTAVIKSEGFNSLVTKLSGKIANYKTGE